MSEPFADESNATASWFLGPRAENGKYVKEFYQEIIRLQIDGRKKYYPEDKDFITEEMQESSMFKENMEKIRTLLFPLLERLSDKAMPFWSPRYMGHMAMEQTMASNLGYVAALQYNQNNIAVEGSPFTTSIEIEVGLQLCEMFGFNIDDNNGPKGWGHLTSGGSVANLESIWASRNLKFYPLSLRLAIDEGQLSFIGPSFKVELANGQKHKLLKDCTTWELLNLKPTTILDIPERLYQKGITPQYLEAALNDYSIQTVGKDYLERKFGITKPSLYFASMTKHYSFPKGCAITGIGSENLRNVPVDNMMRMDIDKLEAILAECAQNKQAVYAVAAIMGTTEHGACDPLDDIVKLRNRYQRKYGLSFTIHADGAWGGYFCSTLIKPPHKTSDSDSHQKSCENLDDFVPKLALNPYTEKHLRSMRYSDSVTVDPHKSGYVPYPAGALCYRDQRMKYLTTWKAPVVVRPGESESIGIYGVEGSKSGAASVSVWLSHSAIGLHQKGYGSLLGQAIFTCSKMYCHWATMSTDNDDFIVTPLAMLPAEKLKLPDVEVRKQKKKIHDLIVTKSNRDIINSKEALELIKIVGSDLVINTFACNFKVNGKVNEDIAEANYLNHRLFESFSINGNESNKNKPLILTSTVLKQSDYGDCLRNYKNRLGLKGDQDLYVLINVVMTPWPTKFDFITELTITFKNTLKELVKESISRNTDVDEYHDFVMQGTDKIYLTNRSMYRFETHRHQIILKVELDKKQAYKRLREENPSRVLFLRNKDKIKIDQITHEGKSFRANIYASKGKPLIRNVRVTTIKLLKKRHLGSLFQDAEYPINHVPFYIYGTKNQLHIDHMLLKYPSIQLSADNIQLSNLSGKFTEKQREKGVIAHITDFYEIAMQPIQQKLPDSFFFKANKCYNVELYDDPTSTSTQNGPGLNDVDSTLPFATGKIRLPSFKEGSLFIDSDMINSNSVKPRLEQKPLAEHYKNLTDSNLKNWYKLRPECSW